MVLSFVAVTMLVGVSFAQDKKKDAKREAAATPAPPVENVLTAAAPTYKQAMTPRPGSPSGEMIHTRGTGAAAKSTIITKQTNAKAAVPIKKSTPAAAK